MEVKKMLKDFAIEVNIVNKSGKN